MSFATAAAAQGNAWSRYGTRRQRIFCPVMSDSGAEGRHVSTKRVDDRAADHTFFFFCAFSEPAGVSNGCCLRRSVCRLSDLPRICLSPHELSLRRLGPYGANVWSCPAADGGATV